MPTTPPVEAVGVDVLLAADPTDSGTYTDLAAQTDNTLNISQELREIITKDSQRFVSHLSGRQEWSVDNDFLYLNNSDEFFISNGDARLMVDDGTGTSTYVEFPRLTNIELNLTQNLAPVSSLDRDLWRYLRPAELLWTISITGNYFEPTTTEGEPLEILLNAKETATDVPIQLEIAERTFEGSVAVGDFSVGGSTGGESAELTFELGGNGVLTKSGTVAGTSTETLLDQYFDQSLLKTRVRFREDDTAFDGQAYLGELTVSVTEGEEITMSASLEGTGPISQIDTSV